jgi:hypothetical protein
VLRAPAGSSSSVCVFSKPLVYALAACVYALLYCAIQVPDIMCGTATAVLCKCALHLYMSVHGVDVHAVSDCQSVHSVHCQLFACFRHAVQQHYRGATKLGACCGLRQYAY